MSALTQTDQHPYLARLFNPANREAVLTETFDIAESRLDSVSRALVERCWKLTRDLYEGRFPGYRACNTEYHDFNHTCDVFGASVRLCDGAISRGIPVESGLQADIAIAAMLHDAGYIQETGDDTGTGAKFTRTHVARSIAFTERHRDDFALDGARSARVGRLIAGTDLSVDLSSIPFETPGEAFACKILATADLLGQMADRTYLEKLLFLYYEFHEAGYPGYDTEFDILRKTLGFYELTKKRLFETLDNTASLALDHFESRYGVASNLYLESIERQMDYLRSIIEDDTVNFRKKLKRLDLESISASHAIA